MASTQLNILLRGISARGGDLIYSGQCWGSDIILTSRVLRDTRLITALTYVEVQILTREDLYEVLDSYPASSRIVQNAAVRMALKRTVVLLKAYADAQKLEPSSSPPRTFIAACSEPACCGMCSQVC